MNIDQLVEARRVHRRGHNTILVLNILIFAQNSYTG